jgi:hypothetical protein
MKADRVLKKFVGDVKRVLNKHLPRIIAEQTQIAGKELRRRPAAEPVAEPKPEPKPKPIKNKITLSDQDCFAAMEKHGSKRAAARALGIPETTFRERYNKAFYAKPA